jgi:hypothetical protein
MSRDRIMPARSGRAALRRAGGAALGLALLAGGTALAADDPQPLSLQVGDVSAKVGERTTVMARVTAADGIRFLKAYNNRIIMLSSFDDGVAFGSKTVPGTLEEGGLVFAVDVTPTKAGEHPINGVFRIGYAEGEETMKMVSVPLIAKVTGTP